MRTLGLLLILGGMVTAQEQTTSYGTYTITGTTRKGNQWSLDLRNLTMHYELQQYVADVDEKSLLGGFGDETKLRVWFTYDQPSSFRFRGKEYPLAVLGPKLAETQRSQFFLRGVTADVYSGEARVHRYVVPVSGHLLGRIGESKTGFAFNIVNWKEVLAVDTREEIIRLWKQGVSFRNITLNLEWSGSAIPDFVDNLMTDESYSSKVAEADRSFAAGQYEAAVRQYTEARNIKRTQYVVDRIAEANRRLKEQNAKAADAERQAQQVSAGDGVAGTASRSATTPSTGASRYGAETERERRSREWQRKYEQDMKRWNDQFAENIRRNEEVRRQKEAMMDREVSRFVSQLRDIVEQRERAEKEAKIRKIHRTFRDLVAEVRRDADNHAAVLREINRVVQRYARTLSPTTLDAASQASRAVHEDVIENCFAFIREEQDNFERAWNVDANPDRFPLRQFESSFARFLGGNGGGVYGIPRILSEAYKDHRENPSVAPFIGEMTRMLVRLAKQSCDWDAIASHGSAVHNVDQSAYQSIRGDVEAAQAIVNGIRVVRDEHQRRINLYAEAGRQNARIRVTAPEGNRISRVVISPEVPLVLEADESVHAAIREAEAALNRFGCRPTNALKLTDLSAQFTTQGRLVRPGTAGVTFHRAWSEPAVVTLTVEAGKQYTVDAARVNFAMDKDLAWFSGIDFGRYMSDDRVFLDRTILGPLFGDGMKIPIAYAMSADFHQVSVSLYDQRWYPVSDIINGFGGFYYGWGFGELIAGMANGTVTGYRSTDGSEYQTVRTGGTALGGSVAHAYGGWMSFLANNTLSLSAEVQVRMADIYYLTMERRYSSKIGNVITVREETISGTQTHFATITAVAGPEYRLGAFVIGVKYGMKWHLTDPSDEEVTGFSPMVTEEEEEELTASFNSFIKERFNAFFTVSIQF